MDRAQRHTVPLPHVPPGHSVYVAKDNLPSGQCRRQSPAVFTGFLHCSAGQGTGAHTVPFPILHVPPGHSLYVAIDNLPSGQCGQQSPGVFTGFLHCSAGQGTGAHTVPFPILHVPPGHSRKIMKYVSLSVGQIVVLHWLYSHCLSICLHRKQNREWRKYRRVF